MTEKSCYIGQPDHATLLQIGHLIKMSFGVIPYLVGSATTRPDFRDIDIRAILDDSDFDLLFGAGANDVLSARLSIMNAAMSRHFSAMSGGLPIDFQFQRRTDANKRYEGPRQPLGMFQKEFSAICQPAPGDVDA